MWSYSVTKIHFRFILYIIFEKNLKIFLSRAWCINRFCENKNAKSDPIFQEPPDGILSLSPSSNTNTILMFSKSHSPVSIIKALRRRITVLSAPLLYGALLMLYAMKRADTPAWAKRIVTGAFVYLFVPLDAIPDLAPIVGYTDDLGVLTYGLVMIAAYVNSEVRASARHTLKEWIGVFDEAQLTRIDDLL